VELKAKIKQVAEGMGYRYNTLAKQMKEGLTYNVGVIIPERFTGLTQTQSFYLNMYQSIAKELEKSGYYGILHILNRADEDKLNLPRIYNEKRVDAFIFLGQINKTYIEKLQDVEIPKIFLDFYDEQADIDAVITDNFYGAYEMTNYLIKHGHREIGFVGNLYSTSSIQDRFLGFYKSLLEHKIELNYAYVIKDRNEHGAFIDLELPDKLPSAFVCNCDQVAHHLVNKLKVLGYRIPEDCSIVGFDNDIYATITEPSLTTIEVNIQEMAKQTTKSIVEKIQNNNQSFGRISVKGKLIYRNSVTKVAER
ncbi:substrate-binding domain-containing protein, partial [Bacillus horti]